MKITLLLLQLLLLIVVTTGVGGAAFADYKTAVLADPNIVAYWRFEENNANAVVAAPEAGPPVQVNATIGANPHDLPTGASTSTGAGIGFKGSGAPYMQILHQPKFQVDQGTIMFWFKPDASPKNPTVLFQKGDVIAGCTWDIDCPLLEISWERVGSEEGIKVRFNDGTVGGDYIFVSIDGKTREQHISYGAPYNDWHHLALTFDATDPEGDIKIYLDGFPRMSYRVARSISLGNSDATVSASVGLTSNQGNIWIGDSWDAAHTFQDRSDDGMDELAIFSRALTLKEIQDILEADFGSKFLDTIYFSNAKVEKLDGQKFDNGDVGMWSRAAFDAYPPTTPGPGLGRGLATGWAYFGEQLHGMSSVPTVDAFHIDTASGLMYFSHLLSVDWWDNVNDVKFSAADGDIVRYNPATHHAEKVFCEAQSFNGGQDVIAFSIKPNGNWLMSVQVPTIFWAGGSGFGSNVIRKEVFEFIPEPGALTSPATPTCSGGFTTNGHTWVGIPLNTTTVYSGNANINAVHAVTDDLFLFSIAAASETYIGPGASGEKVRDGDIALYDTLAGKLLPSPDDPNMPFPLYFSEDAFETAEDVNAISLDYIPSIYRGLEVTPIAGTLQADQGLYCEGKEFQVRAKAMDNSTWVGTLPSFLNSAIFELDSGAGEGTWTQTVGPALIKWSESNGKAIFVRTSTIEAFDYSFRLDYEGANTASTYPDTMTVEARHWDASNQPTQSFKGTADVAWKAFGLMIEDDDTAYAGGSAVQRAWASGTPNVPLRITAYGDLAGTGSCEVIEAFDGAQNLIFAAVPVDPSPTAGLNFTLDYTSNPGLNSHPIPEWTLLNSVQFTDGMSERITLNYPDVGEFTLVFVGGMFDPSGDYLSMIGNYPARFYPHKTRIQWVRNSSDQDVGSSAAAVQCDASTPPTAWAVAGEAFKVRVEVLNDANGFVPGFDPNELLLESVAVTSPDPNLDPTSYFQAGSGIKDPNATFIDFNAAEYDEAGSFSIRARIPNYKGWTGVADIASTAKNVGRFRPDHFESKPADNVTGSISAQCMEGSGVAAILKGAPLNIANGPGMRVRAINADGIHMLQYPTDACHRLSWSKSTEGIANPITDPLASPAIVIDPNTFVPPRPTLENIDQANGWFTARFPTTGGLTYPRGVTPGTSHASNIQVQLKVQDEDGVTDGAGTQNFSISSFEPVVGGTQSLANVHYARLRIQSTYGDERVNRTLPIYVESVSTNGGWQSLGAAITGSCSGEWLKSAIDFGSTPTKITDTPVSEVLLAEDITGGNGVVGPGGWTARHDLTGGTASDDRVNLDITAPGVGNTGTLYIQLNIAGTNVAPYLGWPWTDHNGNATVNPEATLRFGIYRREDEVVFIRELY